MLLPYCTNGGIGHFQQKPWSALFSRTPFPLPAIPSAFQPPISQIGLASLRNANGPCLPPLVAPFHGVLTPPTFQRPLLLPLHSSATVRPFADTRVSTKSGAAWQKMPTRIKQNPNPNSAVDRDNESSSKKKLKIFRPWDDDSDSGPVPTSPNAGSSTISSSQSLSSPSSSTNSGNRTGSDSKFEDRSETKIRDKDRASEGDKSEMTTTTAADDIEQSKSAFEVFATNLGKSPDGHRCIYCGKMYSRKYGLKIHLRTHTGFKPLKCKVCQRPFGDPSNLNKHVRLHADVLLSPSINDDSAQHHFKKVRSDERCDDDPSSAEADIRGASASQHYQLSVFKCPFCGRSLVRKRDLERHLASRHPNEQLIDVERV